MAPPILFFIRKIHLLPGLCTILLFPLFNNAYSKNNKPKELAVVVKVTLQGIALSKDAIMKLEMSKDDINTSYSKDLKSYEYKTTGLTMMFKIPLSSKINYGRISFYSSLFKKSYHSAEDVIAHPNLNKSLYIFEAGDSVNIYISSDKVYFNGKGNEKYNCITRLNSKDHGEAYKMGKAMSPEIKKDKLIQAYFDKEYLFYQQKMNILTEYKSYLSTPMYHLISADLWGEYNDRLTNVLYSKSVPYKRRVNEWHNIVGRAYLDLSKKFNADKFNRDILVKSYKYCDFLYKRERFETILLTKPDGEYYNLKYTFEDLFEQIQKKYKGLIYDKLILVAFLTELKSRTDAHFFFVRAMEEMGNNNIRYKMQELAEILTGNAFPFALPDKNGKVHKLSDFKGKLLVMDFWFTGCSGCVLLAEQMKPIIASFRSHQNIVFITVSIDKNKETWLKSLNEGKYNSPHELNLYTDGLATNHPIITHYNMTGYPFLLIISKEGNVISTAPPIPVKDVDGSSEAFINFINKHL